MFSSSMDSARDTSGVAGTVLIPMRFVWPYGGRSVYLSGSFTRWSELLQMSPVEGCPTVFQVIHSLAPGYHQYKFYVDGEWRHDEHQPYISGEIGIVNTVLLATDPNFVPVLNPDIASGSNMDVDNEGFRRVVRLTDGTLSEVLPRISDVDVQTSRQRISAFLSMRTAYELLPESGKVVALDVDLPVKQAFHILHEQGIPMAPLWDFCKGQFVGVLSALDFILILREIGSHGSNLTEEELETHTISAWKEGKSYLNRQNNGPGAVFPRRFIHAGPYDNLKDIAVKILQNEVSTVPVIHSSSEDGSFPQLLHLASLSGILKCICRYFRHCSSSLPILQLPICAIPVGTWLPKIGESNRRPLAMLRPSASVTSALNLLVQAQVSSIPIVDDNDSLLDIYCRSDITALAKDRAYTHINLDEMTVQQALQLGQDSYNPYELRSQRCQMCLRSDSLHKVMERLANPGVRRLIIVEAGSKRVEGVVSLSDIFKFFLC
ncbi:sucrose nonfermenting 4-like protein isoform X1 [Arachis stenosperma]|uniref:sucrose nonfermenting 4-like protein isoform X1 n=1 Tax=Arachis stenosperma TaxID=217475 RepID=UPI0025AC8553|nr:sucrose nonfermenting 4-like protein isoform X1 [Arachis stenosperma]XP_057752329.1 sucrose nonfermenting 4-like protein isoform X1 [Arachis stenosperma]XP_057752339.1 sucrose nonfermenting 4-like protein isoform X1 [Arachis stenosperma]